MDTIPLFGIFPGDYRSFQINKNQPAHVCPILFRISALHKELGLEKTFLSQEPMGPQSETIKTDSTKIHFFNEYLWNPYPFLTKETQGCACYTSPSCLLKYLTNARFP